MFNSLSGVVTGKFPQEVLIDTHGIEWSLSAPDSTLDALPPVGGRARVFVWMQHTDSAMRLYGFAGESDRRLFLDLIKVDGIGPAAAMRIMSNISGGQLLEALEGGDVARLEKVPGVGKKTAAKIMLALKGRLTLDDAQPSRARQAPAGEWHDLVESLVSMGYEKSRCQAAVEELARKAASEDPQFAGRPKAAREEILLRRAIVELA